MIARSRVTAVQDTSTTIGVDVYKSPLIPPIETNGLSVDAATLNLPAVAGTASRRAGPQRRHQPRARRGARPTTAQRLGMDRIPPGMRMVVSGQWFYVTSILDPNTYAPSSTHGPGRLPRRPEAPCTLTGTLQNLRPHHSERPGHHHRGR